MVFKQSGATGLHEGERGEEGGTEERVAASSLQRGEVLWGTFRSSCFGGTFYTQGGFGRFAKTLPLLVDRGGFQSPLNLKY